MSPLILSGDEEVTPPMPEPIDPWNAPDETTNVALHGGPAQNDRLEVAHAAEMRR